jgi:SAM-dependent methyltransferase
VVAGDSIQRLNVYDRLGVGYLEQRRPDPRIARQVRIAIDTTGPLLNVGAGAGSYEPDDLPVVAVEPSVVMLRQRSRDSAPAVRAVAEKLPFPDSSFGSGMAILTVHHWRDPRHGLAELRRVVRGTIVVLSWDSAVFDQYWMVAEYLPASRELDSAVPSPVEIAQLLGHGKVETVPVPSDCTDGFYAAWWRRPEAYLDPRVRASISGIARLDPKLVQAGVENLRADLADGTWRRRHDELLSMDELDAGYRLVISNANHR